MSSLAWQGVFFQTSNFITLHSCFEIAIKDDRKIRFRKTDVFRVCKLTTTLYHKREQILSPDQKTHWRKVYFVPLILSLADICRGKQKTIKKGEDSLSSRLESQLSLLSKTLSKGPLKDARLERTTQRRRGERAVRSGLY